MIPLIIAIAILSTSQILRYYFSYEDFSLLYGVQFPTDSHSIFLYPGFVAYLFLRPLVTIQYFLFGYNPFWYYLVSLALFLLVLVLFYWFMRLLYPQKREISTYATAIMASGYLGIESLTWNVAGGQLHLTFLIFALLTLIFLLNFLLNRNKLNLTLFVMFLLFTLFFFQFRSFLLFVWIPLLVLFKSLESGGKIPLRFFLAIPLFAVPALLVFSQSFNLIFGRISHINIDWRILDVFLKNLGNLFSPSDLLLIFDKLPKNIETILGILSIFILVLPPLYLLHRKQKLSWIGIFFSLVIFLSLSALMVVIAFVGQIPTVWPSSHRFYIVLLPFVSGYFAILLCLLRNRLRLLTLLVILLSHIYFSNYVVGNRWDSHSRHLKYFYETVTNETETLKVDKASVLLTTLTRPYPPGPFVSGSDAGSAHFLAGFYHKTFSDFNLATSPLEAVKLLVEKNLTSDNIYAFDYKRDDIVDETQEVRDIMANGRRVSLGKNLQGAEIEFTNLKISAAAPVFLEVQLDAAPIANTNQNETLTDGGMSLNEYFQLFFNQEKRRSEMTIASPSQSLGEEHSLDKAIDGKYETTWIPKEWGTNGASITISLGAPRKISQIVWASSRTAPWDFRQPSDYELSTSIDGKNFTSIQSISNAPKILTGQFFAHEFARHEVKYLCLIIKKTRGGWTPAVDEIEIFDNAFSQAELENYFRIKNNPSLYFPDQQTSLYFYRQILNQKIPIEINWRVDGDGDYPAGQGQRIFAEGLGTSRKYVILLPKTGRTIKSIRIKPIGFPSRLIIHSVEAWQPSLEEFRVNKDLLTSE